MDFVWDSIVMVVVGTLLLRVAGRKSISQMTVAQTVIMISIGSIIIQPIIEHSIWKTAVASAIFISFLVFMEYLQLKFNFIEKFLTGKSIVVIEDGEIVSSNLKKLRFTVDQLEMRLRQQGIKTVKDIKVATLEPNGQIGYELHRQAQPVTVGDLEKMLSNFIVKQPQPTQSGPIFQEVQQSGHETPNPKHLR